MPRPGEYTLREADILSVLEKEGSSIALVLFPGVQYYTGQWFPMQSITAAAKAQVSQQLSCYTFSSAFVISFSCILFSRECGLRVAHIIRVVSAVGTSPMQSETFPCSFTTGTSTSQSGARISTLTLALAPSPACTFTKSGQTPRNPSQWPFSVLLKPFPPSTQTLCLFPLSCKPFYRFPCVLFPVTAS